MSQPEYVPEHVYRTQFEKVYQLYNDGEYKKAIAEAEYNMTNSALPPYYIIKFCILLASALDNWDDADVWRLHAEHTYQLCFRDAKRKENQEALCILADLREELNDLEDDRFEDLTGLMRDDMIAFPNEMSMDDLQEAMMEAENEDLAGMEFEDAEAVAEAEAELLTSMDISENQAVAEAEAENEDVAGMDLEDATAVAQAEDDIMSTAEPPIIKVDEASDTIKPPSKSVGLRHQKSARFNKGGAFHAQQFSRSMSTSKLRASVLDIDWTPKDSAK